MDLLQASNLATKLLFKHNLWGWRFDWNNRKKSFGLCSYRSKTIFLSKILTPQLDVDAVTNTILHEIAHAMVGAGHGHDYVWERTAIAIGCDGQRCNSHEVTVQAKYLADCLGCGTTHKAHRRPKRSHWCKCNARGFNPDYALQYVQQY